ncbi:MAG: hypothetical protein JXQ90_14990 [Cyclobacteriaceae bacterium]
MEDILVPIVAMVSIFGSMVLFTKLVVDYKVKRKMIEKGMTEEMAKVVNTFTAENKYSALKWGLIALSSGLGIIIINFLPYDGETPLPYGVFTVFVAIGFLAYYFIMKKEE